MLTANCVSTTSLAALSPPPPPLLLRHSSLPLYHRPSVSSPPRRHLPPSLSFWVSVAPRLLSVSPQRQLLCYTPTTPTSQPAVVHQFLRTALFSFDDLNRCCVWFIALSGSHGPFSSKRRRSQEVYSSHADFNSRARVSLTSPPCTFPHRILCLCCSLRKIEVTLHSTTATPPE